MPFEEPDAAISATIKRSKGMVRSRSSAFILRHNSKPSISGIMMSEIIRSGVDRTVFCSAWTPFAALSIEYPWPGVHAQVKSLSRYRPLRSISSYCFAGQVPDLGYDPFRIDGFLDITVTPGGQKLFPVTWYPTAQMHRKASVYLLPQFLPLCQ